jgi:hypothetical protein
MTTSEQRGIRLSIYKDRGQDYSNGGVSSRTNQVTIVEDADGNPFPGPFEATEDAPAVRLVRRHLGARTIFHVEPVESPEGTPWMAGGTYVGCTDSRLSNATDGQYGALSFHDRSESWALYNSMT